MTVGLDGDPRWLNVSVRILRAFDTLSCHRDWLELPNFGKTSLAALRRALRDSGHETPLGTPPKPPKAPEALPEPPAPRSAPIRGWKPPARPPESRVLCSAAPQTVFDRNRSDEVLDVAVKLVRAIQVYRRTEAKADLQLVLQHEKGMRLFFPSLCREETQRLANVLVHVGSLALRHALGLSVVVPGSQEGIEPLQGLTRDKQGRQRNIRLEDGSLVPLEDALLRVFKEKSRMTASDAFELMRDRGWTLLHEGKYPKSRLRDCMDKSARFRRCKTGRPRKFAGRGGYVLFKVVKL